MQIESAAGGLKWRRRILSNLLEFITYEMQRIGEFFA